MAVERDIWRVSPRPVGLPRDDGARVTGTPHHATEVLDEADAAALRYHFLALLESCATDPGLRCP